MADTKILRITELRTWAKERSYGDKWWFSTADGVSTDPVKLSEVPRTATVQVMNADCAGQADEEWFVFRYTGFKTEEEINAKIAREEHARKALEATEGQKVALEFFGHPTEGVSRAAASELLDKLFDSNFDSERYQEYKWENRHRVYYSQEQLLDAWFDRYQTDPQHLRQNVALAKRNAAIERAVASSIGEDQFLDFLQGNYPEFFLKKGSNRGSPKKHASEKGQQKGCLGLVAILLIPAVILVLRLGAIAV